MECLSLSKQSWFHFTVACSLIPRQGPLLRSPPQGLTQDLRHYHPPTPHFSYNTRSGGDWSVGNFLGVDLCYGQALMYFIKDYSFPPPASAKRGSLTMRTWWHLGE